MTCAGGNRCRALAQFHSVSLTLQWPDGSERRTGSVLCSWSTTASYPPDRIALTASPAFQWLCSEAPPALISRWRNSFPRAAARVAIRPGSRCADHLSLGPCYVTPMKDLEP